MYLRWEKIHVIYCNLDQEHSEGHSAIQTMNYSFRSSEKHFLSLRASTKRMRRRGRKYSASFLERVWFDLEKLNVI